MTDIAVVDLFVSVVGEPQPWPKENNRQLPSGRRVVYHRDPKGLARRWQETVILFVRKAIIEQGFTKIPRPDPVYMYLTFLKTPPARPISKWFTTRPDQDNYAYLIANVLEGICYDNDSQIVESLVIKKYASAEAQPGVLIGIARMTD